MFTIRLTMLFLPVIVLWISAFQYEVVQSTPDSKLNHIHVHRLSKTRLLYCLIPSEIANAGFCRGSCALFLNFHDKLW